MLVYIYHTILSEGLLLAAVAATGTCKQPKNCLQITVYYKTDGSVYIYLRVVVHSSISAWTSHKLFSPVRIKLLIIEVIYIR